MRILGDVLRVNEPLNIDQVVIHRYRRLKLNWITKARCVVGGQVDCSFLKGGSVIQSCESGNDAWSSSFGELSLPDSRSLDRARR